MVELPLVPGRDAGADCAVIPGVARLEDRALMSSVRPAHGRRGRATAAARSSRRASQAVDAEAQIAPGVHGYDPTNPTDPSAPPLPDQLLTTTDVQTLLERAAAAADVNGAIIAVVDRNGTILGVRVESGVSPADHRQHDEPGLRDRRRRLAGAHGRLLRQ